MTNEEIHEHSKEVDRLLEETKHIPGSLPSPKMTNEEECIPCKRKQDSEYCGYTCGDELDKIKSFVDNLRPVLKVNPKLAKVMVGKAYNEIYTFEEDIWRMERRNKKV